MRIADFQTYPLFPLKYSLIFEFQRHAPCVNKWNKKLRKKPLNKNIGALNKLERKMSIQRTRSEYNSK